MVTTGDHSVSPPTNNTTSLLTPTINKGKKREKKKEKDEKEGKTKESIKTKKPKDKECSTKNFKENT